MTNKRIYILYGLVFFLSIALFGYMLFPEDKIKTHITNLFESHFPGAVLDMRDISLALPFGIKLLNPRIDLDSQNSFEAEKLSIAYRIFSLFGDHNAYALKARAYDGVIKGTVNVSKNSPQTIFAETHLADIQTGGIKALADLSEGRFEGLLNGDITYDSRKTKDQGIFELTLTECKIPLIISFLDLGVLDFREIQTDAVLTGRNLDISRCTLKGLQVDGEVSGRITVNDLVEQSRLNLAGTLKPHPDFIQSLPQNLMAGNFISQNGISFKVMGTLENPIFSLR